MDGGSQTPEEEKYIPTASERTTNATPLSEQGEKKPQFRQAIPQEEYKQQVNRRRFLGILGKGLAAGGAALLGLGAAKGVERALKSPEPSIEAGKKAGEEFEKTKKKEQDMNPSQPGRSAETLPTLPPWEKPIPPPVATPKPVTEPPLSSPRINPRDIKKT